MEEGQSTPGVGANLRLSVQTVWKIGKRYVEGRLDPAVLDVPRPDEALILNLLIAEFAER